MKDAANPALELGVCSGSWRARRTEPAPSACSSGWRSPTSRDADVHLVLAAGAQAAGMPERATEEARAALALQPDSDATVLAAVPFLQTTDRATALELLRKALARPNASPEVRLAYARMLVADKQYPAARAQFEELLKADPSNPDLLYSLALLSLQGNLRSEARTYFSAIWN